ncbi:hypothetical protein ABW10_07980 [Pluralibacter gergoviae]|nr:hypothetical protein ABW10_07980 [Pluralibacter gergoviae]
MFARSDLLVTMRREVVHNLMIVPEEMPIRYQKLLNFVLHMDTGSELYSFLMVLGWLIMTHGLRLAD